MAQPGFSDTDLKDLIACPCCDALYRIGVPETGGRAVCSRCHHTLIAPVEGMVVHMIAFSLAILVLLITAVLVPFLEIDGGGLSNTASVLDTALSFESVNMNGLALAVAGFIFLIPLARSVLLIYALFPALMHKPLFPGAGRAFRFTEELRPWSMAEVFVIGVAVALVKILDYASVKLDVAFWLFAAIVAVTIFQDIYLCRWTIWSILEGNDAELNDDFVALTDGNDG